MSTDVKRLLAEATPLPWTTHGSRIYYRGPGGGTDVLAENDLINRSETLAKINTTGRWKSWEADAALIVHAVNRLPDYEAAVDALREVVQRWDGGSIDTDYDAISVAFDNARDALRRLRDEVPA